MDVENLIRHLVRQRRHNEALRVAEAALSDDNIGSNFYYALSLLLNKRYQQSNREFESLGLGLCSLVASNNMNSAEFNDLKRNTDEDDLYFSSVFLYVLGFYDKASELIEKVSGNRTGVKSLKGWVSIHLRKYRKNVSNPFNLFKESLDENPCDLDSVFGIASCLESPDETVSILNKSIVRFPSNVLPLTAKMFYLFRSKDFDATLEIVNRIFDLDANNLDATKINVLIVLCRDSNFDEASILIKKLEAILEDSEPKNAEILLDLSRLFSRLTKDSGILSETIKMMGKALSKSPGNSELLIETGYQNLLRNDLKESSYYFKTVLKTDDTNIEALLGLTLCELSESNGSKGRDQIDFLFELAEKEAPPLLYLMKARVSEGIEDKVMWLKEAKSKHFGKMEGLDYGADYLSALNVTFLLDVVDECLTLVSFSYSAENFKTTVAEEESLKIALDILKEITSACPGFDRPQYLLAKILYFKGDTAEAMKTIEDIIRRNTNAASDTYLLMAQMQVDRKMFDRAQQSLEAGLSYNFKVRENALFHLISGLIEKNRNNYEEAVKYFTMALNLANLNQKNRTKFDDSEVSLPDKALIYIELINAHNFLNQTHEASKLLHDAAEEFKNTSEEAKIVILSVDELIKMGEVQTAIEMLDKIKINDNYYLDSRTKLAEIFLKHRKDKRAYLKCYEDMINKVPTPESYVRLGDAYFKILELEKALASYETALKINPKDKFLTKKMGEALIITHNYEKAISYYIDTIKLTEDGDMKIQLADLYIKLKKFDEAESFLKIQIDEEKNIDETGLKHLIKLQKLLGEVYEKSENNNRALDVLINAMETQKKLIKLYSIQRQSLPDSETNSTIDLFLKLAEISTELRTFDRSIQFYKEALGIAPNNTKILSNLAQLYMQMNKMELCQQTCNTLLTIDAENENGTVLMADIAFRKVDFDMSIYHFTQLLSKQPCNWRALVRFIEILRRTGRLEESSKYLEKAEKLIENPSKEPALSYCYGLYKWYSGNLNSALRNFNSARVSSEWNRSAIYNMIDICLNPDEEILGDQFVDVEDIEYKDSRSMALKTADRLLKELKSKIDLTGEDQLKYKLLKNFLLLATKDKASIELALEDFLSLASQDKYKEAVGPILGVSTAHALLKQTQRAKNQLKRVTKTVWSFEEADYLERCWLLLADYYMKSSKYDLALELLKKILQHNRACCKAHEFYGNILEKEQKYKDAAQSYELAWKFGGKTNALIGYRLAYCHIKAKRYANAIDVSQQVLKAHPDYPKIKKDILDKALTHLRT